MIDFAAPNYTDNYSYRLVVARLFVGSLIFMIRAVRMIAKRQNYTILCIDVYQIYPRCLGGAHEIALSRARYG